MISLYDMFKIGIGPSSSHTVGPMKAGKAFQDLLREHGLLYEISRLRAHVYGSLSYTGRGHGTDSAIIAGLAGCEPHSVDTDALPAMIEAIKQDKCIAVDSTQSIAFNYDDDFIFHQENLPLHENGMRLEAYAADKLVLSEVYYSIGGGFIVDEAHFGHEPEAGETHVPYPYQHADDLLQHCDEQHIRLSTLMLRNECALHSEHDIRAYSNDIWRVMQACIERGLNHEGVLPGKLRIPRRAPQLKQRLASNTQANDPMGIIDWVNMIAFAVNEENAAGGRVVTAPTNGACGIVPAVLSYYHKYIQALDEDTILRYFLACSAIGSLYKMNASISGAEVGCQGEVGVACSMAAGGLTDIMGGTASQVCVAAEIAMEHHLGLTCDPLGGQVQVPCIERNAVSSIKAINASRMAMLRSSKSAVSLDEVIKTMYETGKDMHVKYRETSTGGLAMHVPC